MSASDIGGSGEYAIPVRLAPEWQPIETAPKDGKTRVLLSIVALGKREVAIGRWEPREGAWTDEEEYLLPPTHWMPLPEPPRRASRWEDAASRAEDALNDLLAVQQEYEEWHDNLPENLRNSTLGEKLEAVCCLDIQGALDTVSEATGLELPRGFGRD